SQRPESASSLGSGFVIDEEGIIITNAHVILDANEIDVIFSNGVILPAELVGKDTKTDIAVLRVEPAEGQNLVALEFGNSDELKVGQWVMAIGNPFGLGGTVTAGIVSAKNRDIRSGPYDNFIQTDAAINRGNSGGPLFNTNGKVIGINSAIISTTGGSVGIGFAIPSKTATAVIEQLIEYGETRRGWLGVRIQEVSEDIASSLGMNDASGALVVSVDDDGPAKRAGIKSGDIILKFNDVVIDTMRELPRVVAETKVGTRAEVEIWRKNKVINKSVVIERLNEGSLVPVESPDVEDNTDVDNTSVLNLGFSLSNVSKELAAKYDFTPNQKGLVVTQIDNQSDAFKRGLQEGDVINVINEPDLYSVNQFIRIIDKYKKADKNLLLIKVVRGKNMIRVFPIDISID
ncbi:MAG: Do family serine endopeptidase, partial [Pseudomonadota bacterium]|nr:Do family serine endopeptidase [Pseudomonadota bacterium]